MPPRLKHRPDHAVRNSTTDATLTTARHDEARSSTPAIINSTLSQMQLALSLPVAHLQSSAPSPVLLPTAFFAVSILSALCSSPDHSLLATAVSWALLWIYSSLQIGLWHGRDNVLRRRFSWTAGALLALAQVCEQAANDDEGFWWTKVRASCTWRITC